MPNTTQRILPLGISMAPGMPSTSPRLTGRYPTSRRPSADSTGQGTLALGERATQLACRWKGWQKPLILVLRPPVPLPPPQTFL